MSRGKEKKMEKKIPKTLTPEDLKRIEEEMENDAHSCRAESNEYGICQCCGAIVSRTSADYELRGYDPPESLRYPMIGRWF